MKTCPEKSLSLLPRLSLSPQRKEAVVIHEIKPNGCVRCGKPFGTLKAIEAMPGKLATHSMFQGEALERLKMGGDCRVIDYAPPTSNFQLSTANLLAQLRVAVTEAPAAGALGDEAIQAEHDSLFGGTGKPEVYLYGSHFLSGFLNEKPLANLTRQREFFSTHIQPWVLTMCDDQQKHPKARFYAAVAQLTRAFMGVEAQGFDMLA